MWEQSEQAVVTKSNVFMCVCVSEYAPCLRVQQKYENYMVFIGLLANNNKLPCRFVVGTISFSSINTKTQCPKRNDCELKAIFRSSWNIDCFIKWMGRKQWKFAVQRLGRVANLLSAWNRIFRPRCFRRCAIHATPTKKNCRVHGVNSAGK